MPHPAQAPAQDRDRLPSPYRSESTIVAQHLQSITDMLDWPAVARTASPWINAVRNNPPPFWAMETLLKEYPISSNEGLALMRLAEALLRVPDTETAIALTADQLSRAHFATNTDSTLARISSAAIALSKKVLPDGHDSGLFTRLGAQTVVAATLRAVQLLGRQFVLAQDIDSALCHAQAARKQKTIKSRMHFSYDMLGESARSNDDAQQYFENYRHAIATIAATVNQQHRDTNQQHGPEHNDGISIKLSALHPRYESAQRERVLTELLPRVWTLCEMAAAADLNLTIDAEEVDRLELSLDLFTALSEYIAQYTPQWRGFGLALQAYQTRALALVETVIATARKHRIRLMCRLVKGAYWDAEIKRTQELGLAHYPVFTHKQYTDISYLVCARALLAAPDAVYPQFAGHNAGTIAAVLQLTARSTAQFELQRLHGMGEDLFREILRDSHPPCRIYAPVGQHRDLLAYLVRRLLENGANSSFVHQLADPSVVPDALLASPLSLVSDNALPLPSELYGSTRRNSEGLDLSVASVQKTLFAAYATTVVPSVAATAVEDIHPAFKRAVSAQHEWRQQSVQARASVLRRTANQLQQCLPDFSSLLVKEAHKTWADAIGEVREAIDFLRYYASEAECIMSPQILSGVTGESNVLQRRARGVWICISPWNFPLAIFCGQIAAALVTGNAVLAKPAEQTPGVAQRMVAILHTAGVPIDALQLLNGPGETIGAALIAQPGIAGVAFTGSIAVARHINRALAAKDGHIAPLIAETGGINTMLVDSTALPEQVVDAVVQSAFRSAGQRCSALRLLCVHESIADRVIALIQGATQVLTVGNPAELATDIGPIIDGNAYATISQQLQHLQKHHQALLPTIETSAENAANAAHLIPPQAFEIPAIAEVHEEIFGPVLQIVRWSGDPSTVIDQINALGYGLTFGIQTRIDSRAQMLANQAHIGNIYVNRNMIGAVVGVQPFGGEGLSGTGPKAGGPHYLPRFCTEQTVTINTTAAGGNVALLAN